MAELVLTKVCTGCEREQPLENFSRASKGKHGRNSRCRKCDAASQSRAWCRIKADPERHAKVKHRAHLRHLRRAFGIDSEQYERMFAAQKGVCAICKRPEPKFIGGHRKQLSMDHDHTTGAIRGLLCSECNIGLGKFRDNPDLLRLAALYLTSHQNPPTQET